MKRTVLVLGVGVLLFAGAASANLARSDKNLFISAGLQAAMPFGNYGDATGPGIGGMLGVEASVMPAFSITFRAGYDYHLSRGVTALGTSVDSNVNNLPLLLGGRYYFDGERHGVYAIGEAGVFMLMQTLSRGSQSSSNSQTNLGVGAGAGYKFRWLDLRIAIHSHDVGNFGNALQASLLTAFDFAGF